MRASLLQHLAHKAQLAAKSQQRCSNVSPQQLKTISNPDTDAAAGDQDVPAADGSPKRRKQAQPPHLLDQASRLRAVSPSAQEAAVDAAAELARQENTTVAAAADDTSVDSPASSTAPADHTDCDLCVSVTAAEVAAENSSAGGGCVAVLLTAAAKLQQLVEQLTQREPAAAADLSLLQWQLTAAYGSLTGTTSSTPDDQPFQQSRIVEVDSQAGSSAGAAAAASDPVADGSCDGQQLATPTTPAGSMKPQPAAVHPLEPEDPAAAEAAATAVARQPAHSEADAAAARLFCGAATTAAAPQLDWYYLDGGSIRGAHDAALMIRWFCSFYLEDQLPVAGVLQQVDGSSRPPPTAAFQPLRSLLHEVQQGGRYMPHGVIMSATAGRVSLSQVLVAMPSSPPKAVRVSQQQLPRLSPRTTPGLMLDWQDPVAGQDSPALPVSTVSSEPATSPETSGTGAAARWQCSSASGTRHSTGSWGSGGGYTVSQHDATHAHAQQQQQHASAAGSLGIDLIAARYVVPLPEL